MIYHLVNVQLEPEQKLYLYYFGDVHYNANECHKQRFHETISFFKQKAADGHKLMGYGLGDYNDSLSTSERAKVADLHDFSKDRFDEMADQFSDSFYKVIADIGVEALVEGHHYMTYMGEHPWKGATNTKYLCHLLGAKYLGTCGYVKLQFHHNLTWEFVLHHGVGSAQTRTGRVNRRKRFGEAFPKANSVILGHDHDLFVEQDYGFQPLSSTTMGTVHRYYVGSGSYLRGYILGREVGTYIEQAAYKPSRLGSPYFEISTSRNKGKWRLNVIGHIV